MASNTITCLPPEITAMVVDMLGSQATRYNFLLSCRFGYINTLPFLYRDVEFSTESIFEHNRGSPRSLCRGTHDDRCRYPRFWSMYSFTNSVLGNPDLAARVKTFTLNGTPCCCKVRGYLPYFTGHSSQVSDVIRQAIERRDMGDSGTKLWSNHISQRCNMDALLALLLPLLPRLEQLDCDIPDCAFWTTNMLRLFQIDVKDKHGGEPQPAHEILLPPHAFENLHTVINKGSMSQSGKLLFQSLPAVKSLVGRCDDDVHDMDGEIFFGSLDELQRLRLEYFTEEEEPVSHIEEIDLHLVGTYLFNFIDVEPIVEPCHALRSLKLTLTHNRGSMFAFDPVSEALFLTRCTLETLELLYTPPDPEMWGDFWRDDELNLDLRRFKKLRNLKLGVAFVFGHPPMILPRGVSVDSTWIQNEIDTYDGLLTKMLPPNITSFYTRRHGNEALSGIALFKSLGELLEMIPSRFPQLKNVNVDIAKDFRRSMFKKNLRKFMCENESSEKRALLVKNASQKGVDLRIQSISEV